MNTTLTPNTGMDEEDNHKTKTASPTPPAPPAKAAPGKAKGKAKGKGKAADDDVDDLEPAIDVEGLLPSMEGATFGLPAVEPVPASVTSVKNRTFPDFASELGFRFSEVDGSVANGWHPGIATTVPTIAGRAMATHTFHHSVASSKYTLEGVVPEISLDTASADALTTWFLDNFVMRPSNPFACPAVKHFVCAADQVHLCYFEHDTLGSYVKFLLEAPPSIRSDPMCGYLVNALETQLRAARVPQPAVPLIAAPMMYVAMSTSTLPVYTAKRSNGMLLFRSLAGLAADASNIFRTITGMAYTPRAIKEATYHYAYAPMYTAAALVAGDMRIREAMYVECAIALEGIADMKVALMSDLAQPLAMFKAVSTTGSNQTATSGGTSGARSAAIAFETLASTGSFEDFWVTVGAYITAGRGCQILIPAAAGHVGVHLDAYLLLRALLPVDCFVDGAAMDAELASRYTAGPGLPAALNVVLNDAAIHSVIKIAPGLNGLDRFKITPAECAQNMGGGNLVGMIANLMAFASAAARVRGASYAGFFGMLVHQWHGINIMVLNMLTIAADYAVGLRWLPPEAPGIAALPPLPCELTIPCATVLRGFLHCHYVVDASRADSMGVMAARLREEKRIRDYKVACMNLEFAPVIKLLGYAVAEYTFLVSSAIAVIPAAQRRPEHYAAAEVLTRQIMEHYMILGDADAFVCGANRLVRIGSYIGAAGVGAAGPLQPADVAALRAPLPFAKVNSYAAPDVVIPHQRYIFGPAPGGAPGNVMGLVAGAGYTIPNHRFHSEHHVCKVQTIGRLADVILRPLADVHGGFIVLNNEANLCDLGLADFAGVNPSNYDRVMPSLIPARLGAMLRAGAAGSVSVKSPTPFKFKHIHIDHDSDEPSVMMCSELAFDPKSEKYAAISTGNGTIKPFKFNDITVLVVTTTMLSPAHLRSILTKYSGDKYLIAPHSSFVDASFTLHQHEDPATFRVHPYVAPADPLDMEAVDDDKFDAPLKTPPAIPGPPAPGGGPAANVWAWPDPVSLVPVFTDGTFTGGPAKEVPFSDCAQLFDDTEGTRHLTNFLAGLSVAAVSSEASRRSAVDEVYVK